MTMTSNELEQGFKALQQRNVVLEQGIQAILAKLEAKPVKATSGKGKASGITKANFFSAAAQAELKKPHKPEEAYGSFGNPDTGFGLVGSQLTKLAFKGNPQGAIAEAKRIAPTAWGELQAHCASKLVLDDIGPSALRADVAYYRGVAAKAAKASKRQAQMAQDAASPKAEPLKA